MQDRDKDVPQGSVQPGRDGATGKHPGRLWQSGNDSLALGVEEFVKGAGTWASVALWEVRSLLRAAGVAGMLSGAFTGTFTGTFTGSFGS